MTFNEHFGAADAGYRQVRSLVEQMLNERNGHHEAARLSEAPLTRRRGLQSLGLAALGLGGAAVAATAPKAQAQGDAAEPPGAAEEPIGEGYFRSLAAERLNNVLWVQPGMSSHQINEVGERAYREGRNLAFAPGVYELGADESLRLQKPAAIRCWNGVDMIGYGARIVMQDRSNAILADFDPETGASRVNDILIAGFELDGNRDAVGDPEEGHEGNGVLCYGRNERIRIVGVEAYHWGNMGIHYDNAIEGWVSHCYIHDSNRGLHFGVRRTDDGMVGPIRSIGYANRFENIEGACATLNDGRHSTLAFNIARNQRWPQPVYRIEGEGSLVIGNHVDGAPGNGIEVKVGHNTGDTTEHACIIGGTIRNCERHGVDVSDARHVVVSSVSVRHVRRGIAARDAVGVLTSMNIIEDTSEEGIRFERSAEDCRSALDTVTNAGGAGLEAESAAAVLVWPTVRACEPAVRISGEAGQIEGAAVRSGGGLRIEGSRIRVNGLTWDDVDGDVVTVGGEANDTQLWALPNAVKVSNRGRRTMWNGVIGGGPLGGVDLSTTPAGDAGDMARSDGTVGDPDVLAISDGHSWRFTEATRTITPG